MKRHSTDTVSLVFAVVFLGVVLWFVLALYADIPAAAFGLVVAGTLILAGLIGLVSALRPRRPATPAAVVGATAPEPARPAGPDSADTAHRLSTEERERADELIQKIDQRRATAETGRDGETDWDAVLDEAEREPVAATEPEPDGVTEPERTKPHEWPDMPPEVTEEPTEKLGGGTPPVASEDEDEPTTQLRPTDPKPRD